MDHTLEIKTSAIDTISPATVPAADVVHNTDDFAMIVHGSLHDLKFIADTSLASKSQHAELEMEQAAFINRYPIHVRTDYLQTRCRRCAILLYIGTDKPVNSVPICFECGVESGLCTEKYIGEWKKASMLAQCMLILMEAPSVIKTPTWTDVFAHPYMQKDQPSVLDEVSKNISTWLVHQCARFLNVEALEMTLKRWPESVNQRDGKQNTPLVDIIHTSLSVAMEKQRPRRFACVKLLLQSKADLFLSGFEGIYPAHRVALHQDPELVRLVLEAKANINSKDTHGNTMLHYAAGSFESISCIPLLIQYGAKLRHNALGATPLHVALDTRMTMREQKHTDVQSMQVCQALSETKNFKKRLSDGTEVAKLSAMRMAIYTCYEQTALYLLNQGTEFMGLGFVSTSGLGLLHFCIRRNMFTLARRLIELGICTHPVYDATYRLINLVEFACEKDIKPAATKAFVKLCRKHSTRKVSKCDICKFDTDPKAVTQMILRDVKCQVDPLSERPVSGKDVKCDNIKCVRGNAGRRTWEAKPFDAKSVYERVTIGMTPVDTKKCGQCRQVGYCCAACQREDWFAGHKLVCKPYRGDKGVPPL